MAAQKYPDGGAALTARKDDESGRHPEKRETDMEQPLRGYAFNRTRQAFLATELSVADTHWRRLRGLLGTKAEDFTFGKGLWITPCNGVHTFAMRYALDVVYLDTDDVVVHIAENVQPWRITPVRTDAMTVLELPAHTVWNTGTRIGDQVEITVSKDGRGAAA